MLADAYGFLSVFAAGLSLRLIEARQNSKPPSKQVRQLAGASDHLELATDPKTAHAYMAEAVLNFNDQLERFAEVGLVVLLGALLRLEHLRPELLWFAPLMLLVIRPVAVVIGLVGEPMSGLERGMISWFGIRGIGSLYYLMFAIARAVPSPLDVQLVSYVLVIVALSIVLHGITVQPLVNLYERRTGN